MVRADEKPSLVELSPSDEAAIERGLDRLLALQDARSGAFGRQHKVAVTSLAGLALLASGDQIQRGRRGAAIHGAVRYLLSPEILTRPRPGLVFITDGVDQGRMHAYGFAVLFLAQVYGHSDRDLEIREALDGAVRTIVRAQTSRGGWGYRLRGEPQWGDDEASVTVTQIQALRAVRNAGVHVPGACIDSAIGYVKQSMHSDGGVRYSLSMRGKQASNVSFELTAAAVATLNASGVYRSEYLTRGLGYLRRALQKERTPDRAAGDFYFYGNFFAAQAFFQASGADWEGWFPPVRQELLEAQRTNGGWESPKRNFDEAYATASALLILQLPRRYLPIYQR
jgi:hypothetical protein